jgi:hypothetical protein
VGVGVAVACAKAYSQPKNQPWSNQLRADARMAVEAMLLDVDEDMALRPDEHVLKQLHKITSQEALNGIVDEESGAKLKAGESVNKQTSAGLYWNEKPSPNGAKGKLGYIIRLPGEPDRLHDDMQLALDELRALMEKGDYKCMVEAVIKDEPMKPSKLAEGRIRFILVMSMECTLLTREYLFTICRIMSLNPFFLVLWLALILALFSGNSYTIFCVLVKLICLTVIFKALNTLCMMSCQNPSNTIMSSFASNLAIIPPAI